MPRISKFRKQEKLCRHKLLFGIKNISHFLFLCILGKKERGDKIVIQT